VTRGHTVLTSDSGLSLKLDGVGENGLRKHFTTSGWAVVFGPHTASALQRKLCDGDLTETLMLLELCEFCCAGTTQPNGAGLRCRKCGRLTFGAEGMDELEAPCVGCASAREWKRPGRDVPKDPT
jgi:phage FluMu protein Com